MGVAGNWIVISIFMTGVILCACGGEGSPYGGNDYTGEWNDIYSGEAIRIICLDPTCELDHTIGDDVTRYSEDSREIRPIDGESENIVIYCLPCTPADSGISIMISFANDIGDTIWVRQTDIESGYVICSSTYIR